MFQIFQATNIIIICECGCFFSFFKRKFFDSVCHKKKTATWTVFCQTIRKMLFHNYALDVVAMLA